MKRTRCEKPLFFTTTLAGAAGGPVTKKVRASRPARPQLTFVVAVPSFTFAGTVQRHAAFPARARTAGRRWTLPSAYRTEAVQRTPVGRTTTEAEAGCPGNAFFGRKPKRRLEPASIAAPAAAARQRPERTAAASVRANTETSMDVTWTVPQAH